MKVSEAKAVAILMEIGIYNMVSYPTGIKKIDDLLSTDKYKKLVDHMKKKWDIKQ
jgi:hypothetical protein